MSHLSSDALVEIQSSRQGWTGRLNLHENFSKEKRATLSVLRRGIKGVFQQRNHHRLSQGEPIWEVESPF